MIEVTMPNARLFLALTLVTAAPGARSAESTRPEGSIESEGARVEVLARKLPVGQRVELPEGWFRVEEEGTEDGSVGSFTIQGSSSDQVAVASAVPAPAEAAPPAPERPAAMAPPASACRRERSAYLRELWRESGIEVSDPDALIEGLDAGSGGPDTGYYWFAFATDAFRNMAWSSELRGRARDLIRCIRAAGGGTP